VLLRKSVKLEYLTDEYIHEPRVVDLTKKINIIGTMPSDNIWAAEVKIRMKDGQEFSSHVDSAKGNPIDKPLTKEEIIEKYRGNIAFSKTISKENAEKALDMLSELEEIDDISEIVRSLTKQ
jgi:2-methylcitrate dehydratase PrpD